MKTNSTHPMVSVVIPHYGGFDILKECIDSLSSSIYSKLEIIVVDNNSSDNTIIQLKKKYPQVKLVISKYNRGFAGGCNFGVKNALGEYILILNNDTIHEPGWINKLVSFMEKNKSVSSVQPKIKNYFNKQYFDYSGACGGFIDKYCFPFLRGRLFNTIEKDEGQYDNKCKIFWASGTAFLTRKEIFNEIGGFDETLFAHMEEIDFHWKCQLLGYEVWVDPSSVIFHRGAATLSKNSPYKTYLNYRNSLILLLTNYPIHTSLFLFIPRFILECISLIKELLVFNWRHAFAIIKSWFWILINLKKLYKRKVQFQKKFKSKLDLIYQKSIVKDYFIYKKKFFLNID
tara:strand:- start:5073 stop:6104 length:1032 start_codon:yes stop_codon:yes gene_type:complete